MTAYGRRRWDYGRTRAAPVRNIVKRLRRKLGEDASNPAFIFAVPRVGYRMEKG